MSVSLKTKDPQSFKPSSECNIESSNPIRMAAYITLSIPMKFKSPIATTIYIWREK